MTRRSPKAPPTIVEALNSRALFATMFDAPSWRPWIVLLKALFALPLGAAELAIFQHHTGRQRAPEKPVREAALVVGRRGGKSRILALIGVYLAAVLDWSAWLAPGETPVVAIIAADRRQAKVILGYVAGLLHAAPGLKSMIVDELAESVVLSNGVALEIHTGSVGAPRGRTFIAVLADEIAFWVTDAGAANPDREIVNAVRPGLASLPGSLLLIASSPYARKGVLFEAFSRGWGRDDAPVLVWRGTTQEMNAGIDPRVIEDAYASDPESAAAEYGAEFRGDVSDFLDRELVEAAVDDVLVRPPRPDVAYVAFVDASGGRADSFTVGIAHAEGDKSILDCLLERKAPFVADAVMDEIAALLRSYGVTRVVGDNYGANWTAGAFEKRGIRYAVSERPRSAIYADLLPLLTSGRARMVRHPRLVYQLTALERRTTRSGKDEVNHPRGGADDLANACAGALVVALTEARPALVPAAAIRVDKPEAPLGFVDAAYGVLWIAPDGEAAYAVLAHVIDSGPRGSVVIAHFDQRPWTAVVPETVATLIDEVAERARDGNPRSRNNGVSGLMYVPRSLNASATRQWSASSLRGSAASTPGAGPSHAKRSRHNI